MALAVQCSREHGHVHPSTVCFPLGLNSALVVPPIWVNSIRRGRGPKFTRRPAVVRAPGHFPSRLRARSKSVSWEIGTTSRPAMLHAAWEKSCKREQSRQRVATVVTTVHRCIERCCVGKIRALTSRRHRRLQVHQRGHLRNARAPRQLHRPPPFLQLRQQKRGQPTHPQRPQRHRLQQNPRLFCLRLNQLNRHIQHRHRRPRLRRHPQLLRQRPHPQRVQ